jgi:hypothetical protein
MSAASEVAVAGFAFAGDFQSAAKRFPTTFKLYSDQAALGNDATSFSRLVVDQGGAVNNPAYHFSAGGTKNLRNDNALMAVLVLTGETVATERFGNNYKTYVILRGNSLIFDYKSHTIVQSCPVSTALFDASPQPRSKEQIAAFVDELVRRKDANGLVTQFARCLERAAPAHEGLHTVQVRRSEISPEALAQFPEALRADPAAAQAMLADSLGTALSTKLGLSMLPSSIGHAVGGVMSMRLENGDDIKLKLGEGDYVFDVKLNKFAKVKFAENNVGTSWVYGAYLTLQFLEPQLNTSYIATDLKNGETGIQVAGQVNDSDFPAFQDAIRGLFNKFTDALQKPGSNWLETAASVKPIEPQMASARDILRTCK